MQKVGADSISARVEYTQKVRVCSRERIYAFRKIDVEFVIFGTDKSVPYTITDITLVLLYLKYLTPEINISWS